MSFPTVLSNGKRQDSADVGAVVRSNLDIRYFSATYIVHLLGRTRPMDLWEIISYRKLKPARVGAIATNII